jgi:hypothetical protein
VSLPYTVAATNGPGSIFATYTATSMSKLLHRLATAYPRGLSQQCPSGGCFAGANPPAGTLLILFLATGRDCQTPTSYAIHLTDPRTLRIDVQADDTCPPGQTGGDAAVLPPDVLLAIPLDRLPASGQLAIVIYPYGPGFGGHPETGTATLP